MVGRGREISEEHDGDGRVGERRRGKGFRGKVQPKKRRASGSRIWRVLPLRMRGKLGGDDQGRAKRLQSVGGGREDVLVR